MSDELVSAGFRLAIRSEGKFINAYMADMDGMADAMLLGSIRVSLVKGDDTFFPRWRDLVTEMFKVIIDNTLGTKAKMVEQPAPEHERSGHG